MFKSIIISHEDTCAHSEQRQQLVEKLAICVSAKQHLSHLGQHLFHINQIAAQLQSELVYMLH